MQIIERIPRRYRPAIWVALALVVYVVFTVDHWGRDFTTNEAEIARKATDPRLEPETRYETVEDVVEGLKWAATRIGGWEYVGSSTEDDTTHVLFVRKSRFLQLRSDVEMRIVDRGKRRIVYGSSRSRFGVGDLGQNPRNLHQLLTELRAVMKNTRRGAPT